MLPAWDKGKKSNSLTGLNAMTWLGTITTELERLMVSLAIY